MLRQAQSTDVKQAERDILSSISGVKGRGSGNLSESTLNRILSAAKVLEEDGGVPNPTASPLLDVSAPLPRTLLRVQMTKQKATGTSVTWPCAWDTTWGWLGW